MTRTQERQELISQVGGARSVWFERSCVRRQDDGRANKVEAESGDESAADDFADDELQIRLKVGIAPEADGSPPRIRLRERLEALDEDIESTFDVEVHFTMKAGFQVENDDLVHAFVDHIGAEYVLGLLRSAYADAGRQMGIEPALVPAVAFGWRDMTRDKEHSGTD